MKCKTLEELSGHCKEKGYAIGFSENLTPFLQKKKINSTLLQNSAAILPMEGNDAAADGSPTPLTLRRYLRYAASGAALIWMEAVAVVREGRGSPHQLYLTRENSDAFAKLVRDVKEEGRQINGFAPCVLMQLTHSGRYSKPDGMPCPVIAGHNPILDEKYAISADLLPITDDALQKLEDDFAASAVLAQGAGFDGVDIKMSHGYLLAELLAGYTRQGKYGGGYENRVRMAKNILKKIRRAVPETFIAASRLSVYDAFPYPYGFGMCTDGSDRPDFLEPIRLIRELREIGLDAVGVTMGNPYYTPHITRPFEKGPYIPPEPPLAGVSKFLKNTAEIKKMAPEMMIVGAGYSCLGQFGVQAAAYSLEKAHIDLAGWGRQAFACPQFMQDVLQNRKTDPGKFCVACSKCSQILRNGGPAGCPVRDPAVYLPFYHQYCK